jgi:hypothetical protein
MTTTRANFDRNESGNAIVYDIVPIPADQVKVFGSGTTTLVLQTIVVFFLGLIPTFLLAFVVGIFAIPVAIAIPVLFWRWSRRKIAQLMGTRKKAQVSIQDDALRIAREDGTVTVPAKQIRRLLIGNTYDKNRGPDDLIVTTNPSTGQIAGAAMRANLQQKIPKFCFSLELQHGNDTSLIVDGLDELTANNLLDDMSRDLQMA